MALLHRATLRPRKLDLISGWLPGRDWFRDRGTVLTTVAAYRFDDPAGTVGIETILVRAGDGPVYHLPLTYRDAPLDGAEDSLIGTADHSVLGRRWVYDACRDPVYASALADVIAGRVDQAEEYFEVEGEREPRAPTMTVTGSGGLIAPVSAILRVVDGDPTLIVTDSAELSVVRRLERGGAVVGATLTGTWPEQPSPLPLVYATPR